MQPQQLQTSTSTYDEHALEAITERLLEKFVPKVLENIGYDITTPEARAAIREDHAWVRRWRNGSNTASVLAAGAGITSVVGGVLWLIGYAIKVALRGAA